ncbi:hypothetical protein L1987_45604 [Smallanthus sonchifolius]|uniref:Uncharacterized protein n=1 Tax=Smallanthus sonchifolius TaxID=185202 RepID=A0ACB9FYG2_9ASTR|nr:hypothetical protein L1987_45604 [Smallanthus sonchifolius]
MYKDLSGSATTAGHSPGGNSQLTPPTKRVCRSSRRSESNKSDENDSVSVVWPEMVVVEEVGERIEGKRIQR